MGSDVTRIDAGTPDALLQAASLIRTVEESEGRMVCCPEEIAWRTGYIDDQQYRKLDASCKGNHYVDYLRGLLSQI